MVEILWGVHAKVVSDFVKPGQTAKIGRKIAVILRSRHKVANLARNYLTCFACTRAWIGFFLLKSTFALAFVVGYFWILRIDTRKDLALGDQP
jgi:hypothetical protein